MLYVDDLVAAIEHCLSTATPPAGIFELHDGHEGGYQWDDVIRYVRMLTSRQVKKFHVPKWLLEIPAGFNWVAGQILHVGSQVRGLAAVGVGAQVDVAEGGDAVAAEYPLGPRQRSIAGVKD